MFDQLNIPLDKTNAKKEIESLLKKQLTNLCDHLCEQNIDDFRKLLMHCRLSHLDINESLFQEVLIVSLIKFLNQIFESKKTQEQKLKTAQALLDLAKILNINTDEAETRLARFLEN